MSVEIGEYFMMGELITQIGPVCGHEGRKNIQSIQLRKMTFRSFVYELR